MARPSSFAVAASNAGSEDILRLERSGDSHPNLSKIIRSSPVLSSPIESSSSSVLAVLFVFWFVFLILG
eukprot:CAMPEP_0115108044 /NCGR_PEP_ID=MMETSP0227-20121206/37717_1 /TAXON_ID=89957 /ORGANISM="Polarella glacialis, Strain CCMP 1383" /LENGTH=68 /DNA_ID=CAMNT_0002506159 /DNA_START=119 /DNA_END=322 /DNA_ORIENTATION=+